MKFSLKENGTPAYQLFYKGEEVMFLNEYLMFLFKALTIIVGIVSIIIVYFYGKVKLKHSKSKGLLIIKDLSRSENFDKF